MHGGYLGIAAVDCDEGITAEGDPNLPPDAADSLVHRGPLHNATRLVLVRDYSAANSFRALRTTGMNSLPPPCPASSRIRSRLVVHRRQSCQAVTNGPLTS
jgi:hypothetical protein